MDATWLNDLLPRLKEPMAMDLVEGARSGREAATQAAEGGSVAHAARRNDAGKVAAARQRLEERKRQRS